MCPSVFSLNTGRRRRKGSFRVRCAQCVRANGAATGAVSVCDYFCGFCAPPLPHASEESRPTFAIASRRPDNKAHPRKVAAAERYRVEYARTKTANTNDRAPHRRRRRPHCRRFHPPPTFLCRHPNLRIDLFSKGRKRFTGAGRRRTQ